MRDLFTSASASHSYAGRVAREVSKNNLAALDRIFEAVKPTHKEIMQRGKLPRDAVQPAFNALRQKLTDTPNVLEAYCSTIRPAALSAREKHNMRLLVLTAEPNEHAEQWMDVISVNLHLSRSEIRIRIDVLDISMTPHVLARFMQRRQQHVLKFFEGMVQPIKLASILILPAIKHPSRRVAIPHEDGLLLGDVELFDTPEGLPLVRTYDRNGVRTTQDEDTSPWANGRAVAMIRTFVDTDSLGPSKDALRRKILDWKTPHDYGVDAYFEGRAFGDIRLKNMNDQHACATAMQVMTNSIIRDLGETSEWKAFASQS